MNLSIAGLPFVLLGIAVYGGICLAVRKGWLKYITFTAKQKEPTREEVGHGNSWKNN